MPSCSSPGHHAATTAKNSPTGTVTLAARPSIPSVMLTAFTVPTITKAAKTKYSHSGIWMILPEKGT